MVNSDGMIKRIYTVNFLKKILTLLIAVILTVAAVPSAALAAGNTNVDYMTEVTESVDDLYTYLEYKSSSADEDFFTGFAEKAQNTAATIDNAYKNFSVETYADANSALADVTDHLMTLEAGLEDWRAAAIAQNVDEFNRVWDEFDENVGRYNKAIDSYNSSVARVDDLLGGITIAAFIALVAVLIAVPSTANIRLRRSLRKSNKSLVVSPLKFFALNVISLGLYSTYWAWQSWEVIAKIEQKKYSTVLRAYFMLFTVFSLYDKTSQLMTRIKNKYSRRMLAAGVLAAVVVGNLAALQIGEGWAILVVYLAFLGVVTALFAPLLKAQNHYYGATQKKLLPLRSDTKVLILTSLVFISIVYMLIVIGVTS